tara:strand:+ start:1594 stop:1893 length:300 start_codon:yes stop_codon:yes gene_type:complete
MTSIIEPKNQIVSIEHIDTKEVLEITRFQMIQLMTVLYSDRIMLRGGTPTQFFNLHFSNKRKTKKFWRRHFAPYLADIFPEKIPERIQDTLALMSIGIK